MRSLVVPALVALALAGCSKKESTAEIHASDPGPTHPAAPASTLGTTGTAASASADAPVGPPPVCKVNATKSWSKGMNKVAGLTAVELPDGRVAVGAAAGNTPSVLVVSRGGEGKLLKVTVKPGSDLAKAPSPSEGTRSLLRVTPVSVSNDAATAFVDYHDEYKSKRRRVSCGLADDEPFLVFDGVSLLDMDPAPTGDARAALFKKKDADADDGYHEVRDCRSFDDPKTGEKWVVGSDLRGFDKDGSTEWKASLVVDRGAKQHETHLHDVALKDDKAAKTQKFEVPVSHRRKDGGFVLASRMTNALYVGLLDGEKKLQGDLRGYPGFATIPDVDDDDKDVVLTTSFAKGKNEFSLKWARIAAGKQEVPKTLGAVELPKDDKDSETDPNFTRDSKGRRWLAFVDGERGAGKLFILPIDAQFRAIGLPFEVTQGGEKASEARMVPTADGSILVVFLREADGGTSELVTEDLSCEIVANVTNAK